MNELANPELTAVYVESQNEKRERHDSLVTLTAPELVLPQGTMRSLCCKSA